MCKRLCIFSIYDKEGIIGEYILHILGDLKLVCSRIIIVINGVVQADGRKKLEKYTDEICIRENVGYDAGAYRHILIDYLQRDELIAYDEVVLCNDTFFGPLESFEKIFTGMKERSCDFWGLYGYCNVVFAHIQSYFLVFRKNIIQQGLLVKYFEEQVDGNTTSINDVYCQFEIGLFDYLVRQNKKSYALYAKEGTFDAYGYSYGCLVQNGLPIVKKKAFSETEHCFENICSTLSYVKYETEYDVQLILECINRTYGLNIQEEQIKHIDEYEVPPEIHVLTPLVTEKEIEQFILDSEFYIYGAGMIAYKTYWRFARGNKLFQGFIVSDSSKDAGRRVFDYPVYRCSEVQNLESKKVVLGVSKEYAEEIMKGFDSTENLLRIY